MPLPFQPKPLDADAAAYIARSGATDRAAINAFVRGVKALGLWNSMVCWPLRSSQNAGNGDTVYSLGGLGTFNGTRVNGPAWTADGIDINAATAQSVDINPSPLSDFANGHSWFVVMKPTGPSPMADANVSQWFARQGSVGTLLQAGAVGTGYALSFMVNARTQTQRRPSNFVFPDYPQAVKDKFAFMATNASTAASTYRAAGVATPSATTVPTVINYTGTNLQITANGDGRNTSAFVLVTTPQFNLNASLQTAMESLYKSTLGTGLGLP